MPATRSRGATPVAPQVRYEDGVALTPADHVGRLVPRSPVSVLLDTTLAQIAELMAEESIGVVLVRGTHGPAGIVSERDLALAIAEGEATERLRALDVMTPDLASIDAGESILVAVEAMLANEIRHLVVTSGPKTVGSPCGTWSASSPATPGRAEADDRAGRAGGACSDGDGRPRGVPGLPGPGLLPLPRRRRQQL